jgi:hypothetical protein
VHAGILIISLLNHVASVATDHLDSLREKCGVLNPQHYLIGQNKRYKNAKDKNARQIATEETDRQMRTSPCRP